MIHKNLQYFSVLYSFLRGMKRQVFAVNPGVQDQEFITKLSIQVHYKYYKYTHTPVQGVLLLQNYIEFYCKLKEYTQKNVITKHKHLF